MVIHFFQDAFLCWNRPYWILMKLTSIWIIFRRSSSHCMLLWITDFFIVEFGLLFIQSFRCEDSRNWRSLWILSAVLSFIEIYWKNCFESFNWCFLMGKVKLTIYSLESIKKFLIFLLHYFFLYGSINFINYNFFRIIVLIQRYLYFRCWLFKNSKIEGCHLKKCSVKLFDQPGWETVKRLYNNESRRFSTRKTRTIGRIKLPYKKNYWYSCACKHSFRQKN